jgi:hypothetical protein
MTDSNAKGKLPTASGPNQRGYKGETPLHLAAALGHTIEVRELLAASADTNARDDFGSTPLHIAASQGHTETVQTFLDTGAELDARDDPSRTPLHMAASQGHTETVQTLLDAGAELDARDDLSCTPLHMAATQGHTETVQALLDAGADPTAPSNRGHTPLDLARSRGYTETVRALDGAKTGGDNGGGARDRQQAPESQREDGPKAEDGGPSDNIPAPAGRDAAASVANRESRWSPAHFPVAWRGSVRNIRRPPKEKHMPTVSIIGEPGSGKSHFATLLYIHLQTDPELDVYCDFENVEWNTISNADRLVRGIPLEPTPSDELIQDVLSVSWSETTEESRRIGPWSRVRSVTSEKSIKIPIIDSSGELLQVAMGDIFRTSGRITLRELEQHIADRDYDAQLVTTLFNDVFKADRFCFIVDAARGMSRRRETSAQVKHAAFLQNLKNFREANKLDPIKDSMLVFTKYDAARSRIEEFLMRNGATTDGMAVANYQAPHLMAQLTSLQGGSGQGGNGASPVMVVLSSTEWAQEPMTESEIQEKYGNGISEDEKTDLREGVFVIELLKNGTPVPKYSDKEFEKIVQWLKAML